jgi:hypothetical protein
MRVRELEQAETLYLGYSTSIRKLNHDQFSRALVDAVAHIHQPVQCRMTKVELS